MNRLDVYLLIDGEREYQNQLSSMQIGVGGEIALLHKYLHDVDTIYAETFGDPNEQPTMDVFRKIAAICVRAMEENGAPARDITASLSKREKKTRKNILPSIRGGLKKNFSRGE